MDPASSAVATVHIESHGATLDVGDTRVLSAVVLDEAGNTIVRPVNWSSLQPSVASVENGMVTGIAPGTAWVIAASGVRADTVAMTVFARSPFSIEVRYLTPVPARLRESIDAAVGRWRRVIRGDVPDTLVFLPPGHCAPSSPGVTESVDDLLVFVEVVPLETFSGTSFVCWYRAAGLPLIARIRFDDLDINRMFLQGWGDNLVLHEFGHAVGMGEGTWTRRNVADYSDASNPVFVGASAMAAFRAMGGYPEAMPVPIENTGPPGTIRTHWRRSVLDGEIMTNILYGSSALSSLTVSALHDLGYDVDQSAAQPFSPSLLSGFRDGGVTLREPFEPAVGYIDVTGRAFRFPLQ